MNQCANICLLQQHRQNENNITKIKLAKLEVIINLSNRK